MTRTMYKVGGILVLAVGFAGARIASADITVSDYSNDPTTGEYQYYVELDGGSSTNEVVSGDGWVLYDFPGLITSGPNAPTLANAGVAGTGPLPFTLSVINIEQSLLGNFLSGPVPSNSNGPSYTPNTVDVWNSFVATDDPSIENISFVYAGSPVPDIGLGNSDVDILTLWSTIYGPTVTTNSNAGNASVDSSGADEALSYESGNDTVPVPEPMSLGALGGLSLILSGGRRFRRGKA